MKDQRSFSSCHCQRLNQSDRRWNLVCLCLVRSPFCIRFIFNSWRLQFQVDAIAYALVFNIALYYQTQTLSLGFGMWSFEVCYALFISVWGNELPSYQHLTDHQHVVFKSLEGHVHKHALLTETGRGAATAPHFACQSQIEYSQSLYWKNSVCNTVSDGMNVLIITCSYLSDLSKRVWNCLTKFKT